MTQAFNLSQFANFVDTNGKASLTTAVTGLLPVANGGTNKSSFTNNSLVAINSSGAFTELTGTTGQIVQHNGTTWVAGTAAGGATYLVYTTSGSWTVPAGVTSAVICVAGGGGGGWYNTVGAAGGAGAIVSAVVTGLSGTITITVGAGAVAQFGQSSGQAGTGGTSSFGSYITCTGGIGAYWIGGGLAGVGTVGTVSLSGATQARLNLFDPIGATATGETFTTWNLNYTRSPGSTIAPTSSLGTNLTKGNGMGGAIAILY